MSKFTGKQSKGAARVLREVKRDEATARQAAFDEKVANADVTQWPGVDPRKHVNFFASKDRGFEYKHVGFSSATQSA